MAQSGDQLNENMSKELMRAIQNEKHHNKSIQGKSVIFTEESHSHKKRGH